MKNIILIFSRNDLFSKEKKIYSEIQVCISEMLVMEIKIGISQIFLFSKMKVINAFIFKFLNFKVLLFFIFRKEN